MGKDILFFLAGWFSVAIGFEVAPMYGNIAGVASFIILHIWFSRPTRRAPDVCPHCENGIVWDAEFDKWFNCSACHGTGKRR